MIVLKIVKMVVAREELAVIVTPTERQLRPDVALIGTRDMIRNEVDDHLEAVLFAALEQGFEFIHPLGWFHRIVRTNIEVVFDRVRTARLAFADVRIVRRLTYGAVIRSRGLLENAREPNMRDAEFSEGVQRGVVDVRELAAAVFSQRAMRFVGGVGIPKVPHHELVDYRALGVQ